MRQKYALLSVYDKTGIVELAQELSKLGYNIICTGGTAKVLQENGIKIIPIQEITGNPEGFDGRMKTVSFQIESGIVFDRTNPKHVQEAEQLGIKPIDVVVCNLYPFEQAIGKENVLEEDAIENIDVGGPTMIRAAAKNFKNVLVMVDHNDYKTLTKLLNSNKVDENANKHLAAKAFAHLSLYDSQIAKYLRSQIFPEELTLPGRKMIDLRYGENPHQKAAVYLEPNSNSPFKDLVKLSGRDLSLTNLTDINAGIESVRLFNKPCAVVIKHNCPCGIARGDTVEQAVERALEADPESAFGGVVVTNQPFTLKAAKKIEQFKKQGRGNMDIIAAPEIEPKALGLLKEVRKTTGVYTFGQLEKPEELDMQAKFIVGGFVLQTTDIGGYFEEWKVVTENKPTEQQLKQMRLAWKFICRIKSNAIIIMDEKLPMTRGIGTGQTSRVRSTKIAIQHAGKYAKNGILASDSFFPFNDSVQLAVKAGISAIVQQGGSINDRASIDAANAAGIPMVFTGYRAFWH